MGPTSEERMSLAIEAIKSRHESISSAAKAYDVPRSTLTTRINGTKSKATCRGTKRLTSAEEIAVVNHVKSMDHRFFPLTVDGVVQAANCILSARNERPVSRSWGRYFIQRTPGLGTRIARAYDYRRALSEDPVIMKQWFERVATLRSTYDIHDSDVYNMGETGFMMGIIDSQMVVVDTSCDRETKKLQQGNKESVSMIACIGGGGHSLPPTVIFKGSRLQKEWFLSGVPQDWSIMVSPNGWTSNEIAVKWVENFHKETEQRAEGRYRLLLLDGHVSHSSEKFLKFCDNHGIIVLCLPPHSSHITQPLDVGCFRPLKRAYQKQLSELMSNKITSIRKTLFLKLMNKAYPEALTASNIEGSFRGSGIIPFDPDAVLSKLTYVPDEDLPQTPPQGSDPIPSSCRTRTPQSHKENLKHMEHLRANIREGAPAEQIIDNMDQSVRYFDIERANYHLVLDELNTVKRLLDEINRRPVPRSYLPGSGLVVGEGETGSPATARHCKGCGNTGHNVRSCKRVKAGTHEVETPEQPVPTIQFPEISSSPPP